MKKVEVQIKCQAFGQAADRMLEGVGDKLSRQELGHILEEVRFWVWRRTWDDLVKGQVLDQKL